MRLNLFVRTISLFLMATVFYGCPSEELTSARLYIKEENYVKAKDMIIAAKIISVLFNPLVILQSPPIYA